MRRLRRVRRRRLKELNRLKKRAIAAGAAAAITVGAGLNLQKTGAAQASDPHQLVVRNDADMDLLADREEFAMGLRPFDPDQNRNAIVDGAELAQRTAAVVAALPTQQQAEPGQTYKIEHALDGLEQCDVCGRWIHMGGWQIVNPKLALEYPDPNDPLEAMFLPDLALHYMQHGSFDCLGDIHKGRVDIPRLLRVLELRYPYEPDNHLLPLDYVVKPFGQLAPDANDLDGDMLADTEELAAGYNLHDSDQDANLVPDGVDLARQFADAIDALPVYDPYGGGPEPNEPYKVNHFQRGLELCEICGDSVNMGYWQIVNPALGLTMDVYDIACHYMSHGSLSYSGLQITEPHEPFHCGRVKIALLARILAMPNRCGRLGTLFLPGDHNRDCREDFRDFAEFAQKWLGSTDPLAGSTQPGISYAVEPCDPTGGTPGEPPQPGQASFAVRVDGPYVLFQDMIGANCCADKISLTMTVRDGLIRVLETEHLTTPCFCVCDFPASAVLGPFDPGTYVLEVSRRTNDSQPQLIGTAVVEIVPE